MAIFLLVHLYVIVVFSLERKCEFFSSLVLEEILNSEPFHFWVH